MADACAAHLAEMNPFVAVKAGAAPAADEQLASAVSALNVQLLLLCGAPSPLALRYSAACRAAGVPFAWACVRDAAGFYFLDLGEAHTARSAQKKAAPEEPPPGGAAAAAPAAEKARTLRYIPLGAALQLPPGQLADRTTSAAYWRLRACVDAEAAGASPPSPAALAAAAAALGGKSAGARAALGEDALASLAGAAGEHPAVSAVLGGVLANDVMKLLSGVGEPAHNFFSFDAETSVGQIDCIGCPPPAEAV